MKSLIVLALPHALSSLVYQVAQQSLQLRQPIWTTSGEILNNDRHILYTGDRRESGLKYLPKRHAPAVFEQVTAFLDEVAQREGFIYKDVVHPFVIAAWKALRQFNVLVIKRPLVDVAYAVLQEGWQYPAYAVRRVEPCHQDILRGLILAEQTLMAVPAEVVYYDALINNEAHLQEALLRLYPGQKLYPAPYIDSNFAMVREGVIARRRTAAYQALEAEITALQSSPI
ncbi:hypothetical protein [Anthocerotibacter panamensis]|uniref:hypothetical protein n=1 Tax=Anthocerotibacter panamensis TaxID=2857077 RepID=UPI001C407C94|nr:hypothetical protein [Anthocerotibacter panamensis]